MHTKYSQKLNYILPLSLVVLTSSMTAGSLQAQTLQIAQVRNLGLPSLPPPEVRPTPSPSPVPQPSPVPPPQELPSTPALPSTPEGLTDSIIVKEFEFTCDEISKPIKECKIFTLKELKELLTAGLPYKRISVARLLQIAKDVAKLYSERGYETSGAIVHVNSEAALAKVEIQVIEGKLEDIKVVGTSRLDSNYVRSRLMTIQMEPLNIKQLQEALQLLQLNPLIKKLKAQLLAGAEPGNSILEVEVEEADSFTTPLSINNSRSPSIGSIQRRMVLSEGDFSGLGDSLSIGYTNTDGSNGLDMTYTLPINPYNGTLSFSYSNTSSNVIETPFNRLNINSNSRSYEVTLRQPIIQSIDQQTFQEVALGVTASRRESETSLLGIPFPLSPGADDAGSTRISALRFSQEYTLQNAREVFALRSQFSLGLDALNANIYTPIPGVNEVVPDTRFFSWQGQAQYVRILAPESLLLARANIQLADRALLGSEQFAIGGFGSVRGYRQDILLADSGIFASTEVQIPVLRVPEWQGILQIVPFVDYGSVWNSFGRDNPSPNYLASVGLGLQWRMGNNFTARFDWGIPLVSVSSPVRTWQENGLYFSVQWNPF